MIFIFNYFCSFRGHLSESAALCVWGQRLHASLSTSQRQRAFALHGKGYPPGFEPVIHSCYCFVGTTVSYQSTDGSVVPTPGEKLNSRPFDILGGKSDTFVSRE